MTAALLQDHEIPPRNSSASDDDFIQRAARLTGLDSESTLDNQKPKRVAAAVLIGVTAAVAVTGAGSGVVNTLNQHTIESTSNQEGSGDPLAKVMYPEDAIIGNPQEITQDGPGSYKTAVNIIEQAGIDTAKIDLAPTLTSSENLGIMNPGDTVVVVKTDADGDGNPDYIATTPEHVIHKIADGASIPSVETH